MRNCASSIAFFIASSFERPATAATLVSAAVSTSSSASRRACTSAGSITELCGASALAACVTRPIHCWSNSPGTARSATLARSSVSYGLRTALSVASVTASSRPSGEKRSAWIACG